MIEPGSAQDLFKGRPFDHEVIFLCVETGANRRQSRFVQLPDFAVTLAGHVSRSAKSGGLASSGGSWTQNSGCLRFAPVSRAGLAIAQGRRLALVPLRFGALD